MFLAQWVDLSIWLLLGLGGVGCGGLEGWSCFFCGFGFEGGG